MEERHFRQKEQQVQREGGRQGLERAGESMVSCSGDRNCELGGCGERYGWRGGHAGQFRLPLEAIGSQ